jgi:hypothetical protein
VSDASDVIAVLKDVRHAIQSHTGFEPTLTFGKDGHLIAEMDMRPDAAPICIVKLETLSANPITDITRKLAPTGFKVRLAGRVAL